MRWRKIVVGGAEWKYHVGQIHAEARCGERKLLSRLTEIIGLTWDVIERGQWKQTSDGAITPKHIAAWIAAEGGVP